MTVLPCKFVVTCPVTAVVTGLTLEGVSCRTILLAIPKPPASLNARPSASEANSPSAPLEPEAEPLSSPSRPLPLVIGFSNSFIICASNSWAACTSRGCG